MVIGTATKWTWRFKIPDTLRTVQRVSSPRTLILFLTQNGQLVRPQRNCQRCRRVPWRPTKHIIKSSLTPSLDVFERLIFSLFGVYAWELCMTFEFEWSLLTGRRKFRWPLVCSIQFHRISFIGQCRVWLYSLLQEGMMRNCHSILLLLPILHASRVYWIVSFHTITSYLSYQALEPSH